MKKVFKLPAFAFLIGCIMMFFGCLKDAEIPTLRTIDFVTMTPTSAITGGVVTSGGGADIIARGVCWSTTHNPTIVNDKTSDGAGSGAFTSNISGLTANTTYYVRAYATNSAGTAYGNEIIFDFKLVLLPTLTTNPVTSITVASAVSGGIITDNSGENVTDSGICWGTTINPTTSNSKTINGPVTDSFTSLMNRLDPSTTYYVRSYATNSAGTSYGNELSFTTSEIGSIIFNPDLTYGSVSDIDGNIYKTIQIGTQLWMAENLRTTKFNDGSSIPYITQSTATTPGYSWYNDDASSYKTTFGALYNWYAVTDSRKLCPAGWHVPASTESSALTIYLGDATVAGGKLKETGTSHWLSPNYGGFNESGFTGLPGGRYYPDDEYPDNNPFMDIGYQGFWWLSTSKDPNGFGADYLSISWYGPALTGEWQFYKTGGISVRCLKDD